MKLVIDIVLLVIIALCTWKGYKKGLIGNIISLFIIMIALLGGTILSKAYSGEVIPVLRPFIGGYVDSQNTRDKIIENMGYKTGDYSLEDILARDSSLRYDYAYESMLDIGFYEKTSETLAEDAVAFSEENELSMPDAVVEVICDTMTYVAGLTLAFLMILILLVAIGNLFNLSLRLPNMEMVDEIGGSVLGFIKGFLYCVLLCWFLSFLGAVLGRNTLYNTTLARFFLSFKFITNGLL